MIPLRFALFAPLCAVVTFRVAAQAGTPLFAESPLANAFDFEAVRAEALRLADRPYVPAEDTTPAFFRSLSPARFREIRQAPGKAEWTGSGLPFRAQFLHPGPFRPDTVRIFLSEGATPEPVPYSGARFDFGKLAIPAGTPDPAGYAGFAWTGEIGAKGVWDAFATFLGSGYFRCRPSVRGIASGISGRVLAVDSAIADKPEEFPVFKKFWLERPAKGAETAVVFALMDSPSVAGAYRFELTPGRVLTMKVRAALCFRKKPDRLGIAPFSTMFRFGENSLPRPSDFRPEVHDCDGLLFETEKGARNWRPLLDDPRELRHSVFTIGKPRGFGLRQRDLEFGSYEDLDENYHRKPGVWVTPGADWPEGTLQLIELPDGDATWDNVVAYWEPKTIPGAGESLTFDYTVRWALDTDLGVPAGRIVATRAGSVPGARDVTRYVVDFADADPKRVPKLKLEPYCDAEIVGAKLVPNPEITGWRAILDIRPKSPEPASSQETAAIPATKPAEPLHPGVRAWLERDERVISERWDFRAPAVK